VLSDLSEFVVYADESGDHGLVAIDPQYPVLALVFCAVRKADYIAGVVPAVQRFKFGIWGHDAVVLHEHDIRKSKGPFAILLTDRALRERFYRDLNGLVEAVPVTIFAAVIDKERLRTRYAETRNPYRLCFTSAWSGCPSTPPRPCCPRAGYRREPDCHVPRRPSPHSAAPACAGDRR